MAANGTCTTAVPAVRLIGDPVDVVTGAVVGVDREFQLPGPFELLWRRHYDSRRHREDTGCGLGFRFEYDRQLIMDLDGLRYLAGDGSEARFPQLDRDGELWLGRGFSVRRLSELRYQLRGGDGVTMDFAFADPTKPARIARMFNAEHAVSFGYNERGQLVMVADGKSRALKVSWSGRGQMSRVQLTDPAHGLHERVVAEYEYDDAGRMTRTTDPYGHHLAYAYDKSGRLTRFSDRNGYSFHYEYDEHGRCVRTRGDDGVEELELSYDRDARITTATRGNGGTWQYFYDENDQLTRVIAPDGGLTEYQYDAHGNLVREIDPNKQITTHEYDETGYNPVNALPDGRGVDPGENRDPFNAYQRRYRIARAPLTWHRPDANLPVTPLQWEWGELVAQPFGLPVDDTRPRFLSPDEHANLVTAAEAGVGGHREVRDAFGVLVREERHDGPARQYHYDPNGNPSRVTDFDGQRRRYQQASWNHLVASANPLDQQASYEYDGDENLTALIDENGNRSAFRYDFERRVTEVHRVGRLRERFSYDLAGNTVERQDGNGTAALTFGYGDGNALVTRELASGDQQAFVYGRLSALQSCKSSAGALEFEPTIDGGYNRSDLRDGKGLRHRLTWGGVDSTTILDRFTIEYYRFDDGATQMVVAPGKRVHRLRLCGSGVVRKELADGSRETVQYSPQGRVLARLRANERGAGHDTRYQYSGEGDLLQVIDSEYGLTRYEYDAAHRLIRVERIGRNAPEEYGYDAGGNLLRKPDLTYFGAGFPSASPDTTGNEQGIWHVPGNRLHRVHGDYFAYDARDHLSERRSADGTTRYRYDELDRLIAIERPDGKAWSAQYDALGRRTQKTFGSDTWTYYWNGDRLAAEILPDRKLRIYLYPDRDRSLVPFGFVEFANVDADVDSGKHYSFALNHQGSVERVLDEAGSVVWQAELEPFGAAHITVGAGFHQPLRMPGHYCDAETGLHYNRYRYYSPELGRYLQADPIDLEGGHNLYAYAQDSNPLRDVDLFGLACAKAEALLKKATDKRLIDEEGNPGKPFSKMTQEEKQLFCAARAAQLENSMHEEQAKRTTVCVTLMKDGDGNHTVVVTASSDNGRVPPAVRESMLPHEDARQAGPIMKNSHEGEVHPEAAQAREEKGNRDGKVMSVDRDTGEAEPVQKRNRDNPDGVTDHHAEQRAEASKKPGETVDAMGPSKPCCPGCQKALGPPRRQLSKIHPDMRG